MGNGRPQARVSELESYFIFAPRRILVSPPFNSGWRYARSKREYGTNGKDGTDGKPQRKEGLSFSV
jgi:hypothetical protein